MPPSSAPGFDLRNALDGLRGAFTPSSTTGATTGGDEGRDMRRAVLVELGTRSMHGYEVIRAIESRTGGAWTPSAGSVYPTLQSLVDEALATTEQVGERKVYSLTASGRAAAALAESEHVDSGPEAGFRDRPAPSGRREHDLRAEEGAGGFDVSGALALTKAGARLAQTLALVAQTGSAEKSERALAVLDESRRKLYALLAED